MSDFNSHEHPDDSGLKAAYGRTHDSAAAAAVPRAATEAEVRAALTIVERKRLTGIGGWLALFYSLYGAGWFFGIGLLIGVVYSGGNQGRMLEFVLLDWAGRIITGLCLIAAHRKASHRPVYLALGLQILATLIQMLILLSQAGIPDKAKAGLVFVLVIGYYVAWLVYFTKSLRVRYTYAAQKTRSGHEPVEFGQ